MAYQSLYDAVRDLEKTNQLIRIKSEVDPNLEAAEIHRRIYDQGGPAILFERIKGSPFKALSNLYGTIERTEFLFRKTLDQVQKVIELKADPTAALRNPLRYWKSPFTALTALPRKKRFSVPVMYGKTTIDQLPLIKSWPEDGGAFVTLPQVFTMAPGDKNIMRSNLGMYRIQLTGNDYIPNKEIGMHYQLHRGIGVHHTLYNESAEDFKVSIFIGGPPSHAFSAIMPMPEGLSELTFAGMLGGKRFGYAIKKGHYLSADADFVITGIIRKNEKKPEGPFGDHLGYYSLQHDFPVVEVHEVYHRKNAIWHFTVVGRPPQEDSSFGHLIHLLVKNLTAGEFPGIQSIHAVDAAGVHPLLLAVGSERYMPFREEKPEEILAQANRIIGSGQTSLAKYLIIAAGNGHPNLNARNIESFFQHFLERSDWRRDLHFITKTTIDTLDYSGDGWNEGSKVIMACHGPVLRVLSKEIPQYLILPPGFSFPCIAIPGVLVIQAESSAKIELLEKHLENFNLSELPLIAIVDDSKFTAATLNNFLWVVFTRSNPAKDITGIKWFIDNKHWGCEGSLIIDARIKKHHAPELVPNKQVVSKIDRLFSKGGELYKYGSLL
jgi:4-hydroxy-3-polyprenylbenzoate decarboxylase